MPHLRPRWTPRWLLALPLALSLLFASAANADTRLVQSTSLGATQEGIGLPNVREMLVNVMSSHKKDPVYSKKSFATYIEKVQKPKLLGKSFEGIVDPSGVVRILDGHHRARLAIMIQSMTNVKLKVPVEIVTDFKALMDKAKTKKERRAVNEQYARTLLLTMKKGQFSKYTKSQHPLKGGIAALVARVNRFKLVSQVKNDPMRSAVGSALFHMGVNPDHFVDYMEFKIGDWIRRNPTLNKKLKNAIKKHRSTDVKSYGIVQDALRSAKGFAFMQRFVRQGHSQQARVSLDLLRPTNLAPAKPRFVRSPLRILSSINIKKSKRLHRIKSVNRARTAKLKTSKQSGSSRVKRARR